MKKILFLLIGIWSISVANSFATEPILGIFETVNPDGKTANYRIKFTIASMAPIPIDNPFFQGTSQWDPNWMIYYKIDEFGGGIAEAVIKNWKRGSKMEAYIGAIDKNGGSFNVDNSGSAYAFGNHFLFTLGTPPPPPPPPPTCLMRVNPGNISRGESATIMWSSTNATSATINQNIGSVAVGGYRVVSPSATTTYTGTFSGPGGNTTCSTTVAIVPAGAKNIPNIVRLLLKKEQELCPE